MKTFSIIICVPLFLAALTATSLFAHSGGLDRFGCHWDHKNGTYHCH